MARKKSTETIDAEIAKVMADMSKLQDRYDKLAEKLKDLQEQKRRREAPDRGGCDHGRIPEKRQNTRRDHDIFEALGLLDNMK